MNAARPLTTTFIGLHDTFHERIGVVEVAPSHRIASSALSVENLRRIEVEEAILLVFEPVEVPNAWPILVCDWIHEYEGRFLPSRICQPWLFCDWLTAIIIIIVRLYKIRVSKSYSSLVILHPRGAVIEPS